MTNEEVMQLMTDMGLHEGGMDDWVFDNAWVLFANAVASAEREAIVQMIDNAPVLVEYVTNDQGGCLMCGFTPKLAISAIRTRGTQ